MKYRLELPDRAKGNLRDLPKEVQSRIGKKLDYFLKTPNPLRYAEHLTDKEYGEYRFRIGDYRVRFDIEQSGNETILTVLTIRHRNEKTYKDKK